MLEIVDDDVARITDLGSLDGYVDLVPLGRIETFCPVLEVESYLVGFFLCFAIFFVLISKVMRGFAVPSGKV